MSLNSLNITHTSEPTGEKAQITLALRDGKVAWVHTSELGRVGICPKVNSRPDKQGVRAFIGRGEWLHAEIAQSS